MKLPLYAAVLLLNALLLVSGTNVLAQHAPSAGSQLLQIPAPAQSLGSGLAFKIDSPTQPLASSDTSSVPIAGIRFVGANALLESKLIEQSGFSPGQRYSLSELRQLAARVTSYYHSLGYFLAQTYLPAQDITNGVVQFTVVEGRYGTIKLNNQSRLSSTVATNLLETVKVAGVASAPELERSLLMLSDLPGINVKSVLVPGANTGTTDLLVDITEGRFIGGGLDVDNHGNIYTGTNRLGASVYLNQPTGLGDLASARIFSSGPGMVYGQASYQAPLGAVSLGLSYAALRYELGGEFASIQSSGTAQVRSLFLNYPLIRSREKNLSLQWTVDDKEFSDRTDVGTLGSSSEKVARLSTGTLRGDFRSASGQTAGDYATTWTHGEIDLRDPVARNVDSLSAQSQGAFDKVTFVLSLVQTISTNSQLYARVNGQWASKNLDASEKFSLGGASNVRAFPSGEATGDEGILVTLESRNNLPQLTDYLPGKLQLIAFVDAGRINTNKSLWEIETVSNRRDLRGAGLGLTWVGAENLVIRAVYAFKLGTERAQSAPDGSGRFWLQLNKPF